VQIHCKSCGSEVAADGINIEKMVAKCSACNAVFGFADQAEAGANGARERPPVLTPRNTRVEREGADLTITFRWFRLAYLPMVALSIAWTVGVRRLYQAALSPGVSLEGRLLVLLVAVASICAVYVAVAGLLNSARLTANGYALTLRHGPLPAPGGRTIPTSDIEQLFCTRRVSWIASRVGATTYCVHVTRKDGVTLKLLSGLSDSDQALFIEQEIEKRLGIEDRRVRGELHV